MKKSNLLLTIALFTLPVVSTAVLPGCSSTFQRESTGQFVDSSATTLKVKAALLADNDVKSLPITVKTYKDVVQLSGFVDNDFQRQKAISIARHVKGVQGVDDALVIKPR